jgi:hypothetical protein
LPWWKSANSELKAKAAELGAALPEYVFSYARGLQNTLASDSTEPVPYVVDTSPYVLEEAIGLCLYLSDRAAFQLLGSAKRTVFMDSLLQSFTSAMEVHGVRAATLGLIYDQAQQAYSAYTRLLPKPDKTLKGTLCWEFGKHLVRRAGGTSPVVITAVATGAATNYVALVNILKDLRISVA